MVFLDKRCQPIHQKTKRLWVHTSVCWEWKHLFWTMCDRQMSCLMGCLSHPGSFGCHATQRWLTIPLQHDKIYYKTLFKLQQKFNKYINVAIYYKLSYHYQKQKQHILWRAGLPVDGTTFTRRCPPLWNRMSERTYESPVAKYTQWKALSN
jgi:hypothetical protein